MKGVDVCRAAGGNLYHLVPSGTYRALCGHHPQSKGTSRMTNRARWFFYDSSKTKPTCQKCIAKRSQP